MNYYILTDMQNKGVIVKAEDGKQYQFIPGNGWKRTAIMISYWPEDSDKYNMYEEVTFDQAVVLLALEVAKEAHKNQKDKGGNPYINHPIKVAEMLETEDERAVAFLHDIVEDTDITLEHLREYGFPDVILDAVDAMTKKPYEGYDGYIERLSKNKLAVKVKIADMTHNSDITRISNPTEKDTDRINKYKEKIEHLKNYL